MSYDPGRGGRILVRVPDSISTTVNITTASGRAITVYSDVTRSTSVAMPNVITAAKYYFVDSDDSYVVSVKANSVEVGYVGDNLTPATLTLSGDTLLTVRVSEEAAQQGTSGAYAPVASTWQANYAYKAGQVVVNAGLVYQSIADHTSGSVFTPANWTALAEPLITELFIPPPAFALTIGAPTTTTFLRHPCWRLVLDCGMGATLRVPSHWSTYDVWVKYASVDSAAGNITWSFGAVQESAGDTLTTLFTSGTTTLANGAQNVKQLTQVNAGLTVDPTKDLTINIIRSSTADTLTGTHALAFLGLRLLKAS